MNITIIGAGNVATVLGHKILSAGHRILQVYSRHAEHAARLAGQLQADPISSPGQIDQRTDIILIAVSDNAYALVVQQLPFTNALIVHTAGSVPMNILKPANPRYGVLYPLQSLRPESAIPTDFPILIDGVNPEVLNEVKNFADGLSKTVLRADDKLRLKYHLAAIFANNFTNHLLALTDAWCQSEGLSFQLLQPLILETAARLSYAAPEQLQTGPAVRNDTQTLKKHRRLLKSYPRMLRFYNRFTRSIKRFYRKRGSHDV